jgi:hypothetical protein
MLVFFSFTFEKFEKSIIVFEPPPKPQIIFVDLVEVGPSEPNRK